MAERAKVRERLIRKSLNNSIKTRDKNLFNQKVIFSNEVSKIENQRIRRRKILSHDMVRVEENLQQSLKEEKWAYLRDMETAMRSGRYKSATPRLETAPFSSPRSTTMNVNERFNYEPTTTCRYTAGGIRRSRFLCSRSLINTSVESRHLSDDTVIKDRYRGSIETHTDRIDTLLKGMEDMSIRRPLSSASTNDRTSRKIQSLRKVTQEIREKLKKTVPQERRINYGTPIPMHKLIKAARPSSSIH